MADFGITEAAAAIGASTAAEAGAATAAAAVPAAAAATTGAVSSGVLASDLALAASTGGLYAAPAAASSGFLAGLPSLGTVASYAGPVLSAGGTLLQMQSQGRQADYQAAVARAQAQALQDKANQDAAVGEQSAIARDRQTTYALSQAQARAASGGGSATDPTVLDVEGQIAGQGQYNTLSSLYQGLTASAADRRQAQIDLFGAGNIEAGVGPAQAGTVLAGLSSFLDKRARLKYYSTVGESPLAA